MLFVFVARPLTMDGLRFAKAEVTLEGAEHLVVRAYQECPRRDARP